MLIVLLMFLLFLTACETVPEQGEGLAVTYDESKTASGIIHTVRYRGETLALIAAWYAQDQSLWPKLLEANPGIKPKSLQIADKIFIPESLLKQRTAMPASFVQNQGRIANYPKGGTTAPAKKVEGTTAPASKPISIVTTAPTVESKPTATLAVPTVESKPTATLAVPTTPVSKPSPPPVPARASPPASVPSAPPAPAKAPEKPAEKPATVTTPVVPLPALFGPREG